LILDLGSSSFLGGPGAELLLGPELACGLEVAPVPGSEMALDQTTLG
jgi:hypothetical protein